MDCPLQKWLLPFVLIFILFCQQSAFSIELLKVNATCQSSAWRRNWTEDKAIAVREGFKAKLYVLGDIHGRFAEVLRLLHVAQLAEGTPDAHVWKGGDAKLVLTGDLIDKGPASIDVLKYFIGLAREAAKPGVGGEVLVVAGNHEIGFLENPFNSKTDAFLDEIKTRKMDVCNDVYAANSEIGSWLRRLPMAAIINGIYIAHSGFTNGHTLAALEAKYQSLINSTPEWAKLDKRFACGDGKGDTQFQGFFTATVWWDKLGKILKDQQRTIGIRQIIFGHDPGAFKEHGRVRGYFADAEGSALIKADAGLGELDSHGELIRCSEWLANGGCKKFETLVILKSSHEPAVKFQTLEISKNPPPKQKIGDTSRGC